MLTWKKILDSRTLRDQDATRAAHVQTIKNVTVDGQLDRLPSEIQGLGADFCRDACMCATKFCLFDININMDSRRREIGLETETHHHQSTSITRSSN